MSNNVRNINESDDINVTKYIISINSNLAQLNSKVDSLNDLPKQVKKADNKSEKALDLAKKNQYKIDSIQAHIEDNSNNHNQWWMAIISAFIGGVVGIVPTLFSLF